MIDFSAGIARPPVDAGTLANLSKLPGEAISLFKRCPAGVRFVSTAS